MQNPGSLTVVEDINYTEEGNVNDDEDKMVKKCLPQGTISQPQFFNI